MNGNVNLETLEVSMCMIVVFVAFEIISDNHGQELRMRNTRANCHIFAGYEFPRVGLNGPRAD